MKKVITLVSIVLIIITFGLVFYKRNIYTENESKLGNEIKNLKNEEIVNLRDITKFEWDEVYFFKPYVSEREILKITGCKWGNIYESTDESMNQILFLKDKTLVCYSYGLYEYDGYGFNYDDSLYNNGYVKLEYNDNNLYKITNYEDYIKLQYMHN